MGTRSATEFSTSAGSPATSKLPDQYGCGPVDLAGPHDSLYERHLLFDNILDPAAATSRARFEAFSRSVRDILSQRWVLTEKTYARENPKRVYYLSMEYLIGRSLANNITNLLLDSFANQAIRQETPRLELTCSSRSPTPAWEMGVSDASRPASSIRWPRCNCRPWAMACGTNTASSNRLSRTAGSANSRTTGSAATTHGKSRVRRRRWKLS